MTGRAHHLPLVSLVGLIASGLLGVASAQSTASDWLTKINQAAASLSFSGVFVYAHDGQIEAMQVVRRVADGVLRERLYSLNGEPREIVRDNERIWSYLPEQNIGVHDYRQVFAGGFPRKMPGDLQRLEQNYHFTTGGVDRIADRMARRIDVIPNDGYRYGYRLWADLESGLLLRSELIGEGQQVMEQVQFVAIDLDSAISDRALQTTTGREKLVWYGGDAGRSSAVTEASKWQFKQLPAGYRLSNHIRRMSPTEGAEVEHLVVTDGLATVSVFIKPTRRGRRDRQGASRMGAVHAYHKTIHNHRITVLGEAPAKTVKFLATEVTHTQ